jgi:hypothetical protein
MYINQNKQSLATNFTPEHTKSEVQSFSDNINSDIIGFYNLHVLKNTYIIEDNMPPGPRIVASGNVQFEGQVELSSVQIMGSVDLGENTAILRDYPVCSNIDKNVDSYIWTEKGIPCHISDDHSCNNPDGNDEDTEFSKICSVDVFIIHRKTIYNDW